jgi:hypothetical protein
MDVTGAPPRAEGATAVLVQGMHASGTSLLSLLVALLTGERPGESAQPEAQSSGDQLADDLVLSGSVAGINRRILHDLGSSWSNPGALFLRGKSIAESAPPIRDAIRSHYLQSTAGILRSGASGSRFAILEDPCLCLLRDLWEATARETGYHGRTVHIFRNPLDVAALLKERDGLPQARTLQLWAHYNLAALTAQCGQDSLIVPYAELISPDSGLIARLAAYLNVSGRQLSEQEMQAGWWPLIQRARNETSIPDHVVGRSPLIPSIVRRLFALLNDWEAREDQRRAAELKDLAADFEDQSLFAGNLTAVTLPEQPKPVAPAILSGANAPRKLLIHYHLFKNAGTSVDAILNRNFGDRWINTEFPPRGQVDHQEAIRLFIHDNPRLAAISSHTLTLPVPRIDGIEIFPILFVRHPLDRIKSAYEFEGKQHATTVGARIAKELDFAGYVRARMAIPGDGQCRDFQVARLALAVPANEGSAREKALAAADLLPFVGLVEAFAESAQRLQQLVQPMFPEFQSFDVKANVTPARRDRLDERLDGIRRELGEECFGMLMEANQGDMALYAKICANYGQSPSPPSPPPWQLRLVERTSSGGR